ncbi:barstar family protein [Isoptericola sp. b490]|uniref:barstar family protein n=1 Tax=Actinotalea lenta TaxID=3064654 RepID=UPI002712F2F6|nr:barstar family protein [Isoptericola sp. b490]MDO8122548.1 barstar family protein [Isoptericola sp. b490]
MTHPADFALVRGGGIALYWSPAVLRDAEHELGELGYDHTRVDAANWDESTMHEAVAATLDFPGYYGRNLDALADCLGDVAHGDYGWSPERTDLAATFDNFGAFASEQ